MASTLPKSGTTVSTALVAAANAAIGCAVGVLLSEKIGREGRRAFAWSALAVGIAAVVPAVVEYVSEQVSGPNTERGSRDRLRSIRDADSGFTDEAEVA